MQEADETLVKKWDKPEGTSWSGRMFSLLMRPFGYPRLEGGRAVSAYRGPESFVDACGIGEDEWAKNFDRYDRGASRAANRHRDCVILLHVLAALAVLTAVLGAVGFSGRVGLLFGFLEVLILAVIVAMVRSDRDPNTSSHHGWLSLRQRAEGFRARALVRIPAIDGSVEARRMAIMALLDDQIDYQTKAHHRWEKLHAGLERATRAIFYLVLVAAAGHLVPLAVEWWHMMGNEVPHAVEAVSHFFHSQKWLIVTAAGPAFAACLHGIGGKLEVKRLAAQAGAMKDRLETLKLELANLGAGETDGLARLAGRIADELAAEHHSWLSLVEHAELEEPA